MSLDDGYIYPTIVSITSIMENSYNTTYYSFYIMHPENFKQENKEKLKNLEIKYNNRIEINLINMGQKYNKARQKKKGMRIITTPSYYRLSLPDLLPDIDKIIYLDGDTLTFKDLNELYNIDMTNYYYKGLLDNFPRCVHHITKKNDHCICAGVMLINLKELRKDNMTQIFDKFIKENKYKLIQHDQTVINAICYKKIGILPAKYGLFNYRNLRSVYRNYRRSKYKYKYSRNELKNAYYHPIISHVTYKPWKKKGKKMRVVWWNYVIKSGYYKEVCQLYRRGHPKGYCKF